MSNSIYQRTIAARERAKKIREVRESVLARISRREDSATIREYLKHGTDGGVA
jgi:hypothetical protein